MVVRVVTRAEYGGTRPDHNQILFTVFTNANQIMLGVVDDGENTVQGSGMEINIASSSAVRCKAAKAVFAVVETGTPLRTAPARIDLFQESAMVKILTTELLKGRHRGCG